MKAKKISTMVDAPDESPYTDIDCPDCGGKGVVML